MATVAAWLVEFNPANGSLLVDLQVRSAMGTANTDFDGNDLNGQNAARIAKGVFIASLFRKIRRERASFPEALRRRGVKPDIRSTMKTKTALAAEQLQNDPRLAEAQAGAP